MFVWKVSGKCNWVRCSTESDCWATKRTEAREGQVTDCTLQYARASVLVRLTMMYRLMSANNADCMYASNDVALLFQNLLRLRLRHIITLSGVAMG